ncbi:hypothetical protein HKBW3S44_01876, partial [Candidatus Hakubella thermalkaliphila]
MELDIATLTSFFRATHKGEVHEAENHRMVRD